MIAMCNECDPADPFRTPWDEIGKALMAEHLWREHGLPKTVKDDR